MKGEEYSYGSFWVNVETNDSKGVGSLFRSMGVAIQTGFREKDSRPLLTLQSISKRIAGEWVKNRVLLHTMRPLFKARPQVTIPKSRSFARLV